MHHLACLSISTLVKSRHSLTLKVTVEEKVNFSQTKQFIQFTIRKKWHADIYDSEDDVHNRDQLVFFLLFLIRVWC